MSFWDWFHFVFFCKMPELNINSTGVDNYRKYIMLSFLVCNRKLKIQLQTTCIFFIQKHNRLSLVNSHRKYKGVFLYYLLPSHQEKNADVKEIAAILDVYMRSCV